MIIKRCVRALFILLLITAPIFGQSAAERLTAEIARFEEITGGVVGVGALHLGTGDRFTYNEDVRFPMASTYKVPVAVKLLSMIENGEITLTDMITVEESDLHPGSGTIAWLLDDPGVVLSLHNLMEMMLIISDNSATDICIEKAGGPEAVTAKMRDIGIEGIDISRPTYVLIGDYLGLNSVSLDEPFNEEAWIKELKTKTEEDREQASEAFDNDPRDTATPKAMAELLRMIWAGEVLNETNTGLLLDIMKRCETGDARLKGMLPDGIVVRHKTGTIGGSTNDVGIIELPGGAGAVVTVVFVKEATADSEEREEAIAQIARSVYDYYLYKQ
jgi:beta-lactamase class A